MPVVSVRPDVGLRTKIQGSHAAPLVAGPDGSRGPVGQKSGKPDPKNAQCHTAPKKRATLGPFRVPVGNYGASGQHIIIIYN